MTKACGHFIATFDQQSRCAQCRDKGKGFRPVRSQTGLQILYVLTQEQVTPASIKICKPLTKNGLRDSLG